MLAFTYSIRDKHAFQNMLGPLSNKLLLPLNFEDFKNFSQLLKLVSNNLVEIYKYSEIQLETLRDALMASEGENFSELFNIIFDYEKETIKSWQLDKNTVATSYTMPESSQVKRALSVRVMDNENTLTFNIRYRKAIFNEEEIELFKNLLLTATHTLVFECLESETQYAN